MFLISDHRRRRLRNVDPRIIKVFVGASMLLGEGFQCITSSASKKVDAIDELLFYRTSQCSHSQTLSFSRRAYPTL